MQESTALNTQNTASSGFFSSLGNFVKDLVPAATDIYKLQLQGKTLSQQYTNEIAASNAAQQQAYAAQLAAQGNASTQSKLLIYGGLAVVAAVILAIVMRRR